MSQDDHYLTFIPSLSVKDYEAAKKFLKSSGCEIVEDLPMSKSLYFRDPFGELAMAYGASGRTEKAMEFLEKAAAEKSSQLRINLIEPHFDQLHNDPRFQKLVQVRSRSDSKLR